MTRVLRSAKTVAALLALATTVPVVALLVTAWANGWTIQAVRTGSMEPTYPIGSAVVIAPVDPADVEAGTVIGFQDPDTDRLVTHRVVRVDETDGQRSFVTRGDANLVDDGAAVPARLVRGEVRWRVLGLGSLVRALQRTSVQVVAFGVPLLLLLASEGLGRRARRLGRADALRIAALEAEVSRLQAELHGYHDSARPAPPEAAEGLYGATLQPGGSSKVVSDRVTSSL